jgi:hypothetical protein
MNWLPRAMHVLRDELKSIQVTVTSDYSRISPTRSCAAGWTSHSCAWSRATTSGIT